MADEYTVKRELVGWFVMCWIWAKRMCYDKINVNVKVNVYLSWAKFSLNAHLE